LSAERLDDTVATASSGAVNRTDIISLALVFFTLFMLDISTAVAVPNLSTMFAVLGQDDTSTAAYIASIGFVGALFEFLTLPMIAGLSEDVGRRKLIIGIPALCVALSLLAFMVPSVWTLCMWRLLITAVTGWYATMVSIYIADCFADDEIEVASYEGKLQAAMGAADSLGFLIGGYLEGWYTVTAVTLGARAA
jgi:MFS family permease